MKVLDLGLVKDIDTSENARTQLTREGMASGTPAYMPLEITLGKKDADRRADIYTLGAVGYCLAAGQLVLTPGCPWRWWSTTSRPSRRPPQSTPS